MSDVLLLLPDCLLIGLGFLLCRFSPLNRSLWEVVERLVYYLLFPVLLFVSVLRAPVHLNEMGPLLLVALAIVGTGIFLGLTLGLLPGVDRAAHASGAQIAFRFNSFVALAVSERLAGPAGLASMALIVGVCVPVCNIAAVWPLARHNGQSFGRELLRNPLILATLLGLLGNTLGVTLPDVLGTTLQRIGLAALPLGLMAVGAGLSMQGLSASPKLAIALLCIRHAVLPLTAWGLGRQFELPAAQQALLMTFASLPTASSAYVLAARMGGHASFVAGLVTSSTLLGLLSMPAWLRWLN
jgi:malonate transporter